RRVDDADAQVRLQLAYTLGEWRDPRAGRALGVLALRAADDPYVLAAVLSSVNAGNLPDVVRSVLAGGGSTPPAGVVQRLLAVGTALGGRDVLPSLLRPVTTPRDGHFAAWQYAALTGVFDALAGRGLAELGDAAMVAQVRRVLA